MVAPHNRVVNGKILEFIEHIEVLSGNLRCGIYEGTDSQQSIIRLKALVRELLPGEKEFEHLLKKLKFPRHNDFIGITEAEDPYAMNKTFDELERLKQKALQIIEKANVRFDHDKNFKSVTIGDKAYKLTKNQAKAMKLLWTAHEDPNKIGVHEKEIGMAVETTSPRYRLIQTFRQRRGDKKGMHPVWKELIEYLGDGIYRVKLPKAENGKSL